jgi:hypothetical protein
VIEAACHCGAVRIQAPRPEQITECNCSVCRKVAGQWAYFPPAEGSVSGETVTYIQGDRTLAAHHCPVCGCTTHWTPLDPATDRMGVNVRLAEGLEDVRVRRFDGADTWKYLD